jgi:hypothetical protein
MFYYRKSHPMTNNEGLAPRHASNQLTLFPLTRDELIAEMSVSADEMCAWHRKAWLSFDALAIDRFDEPERIEVLFIKGMTRSGLSDAMINSILSSLEKPYSYDPYKTYFSFVENRWISLPPERDPADVTNDYFNELIATEKSDVLRELQLKVSEVLEDVADPTNDDRFELRKADLLLLQRLESAFRNLLRVRTLSPEEIVGLARAIRYLERLPLSTENIDVSVYLDCSSTTFSSSFIVSLSFEEICLEYSAGSRVSETHEFESFPSFTMTIERGGEYEFEGDKPQFFGSFIAGAESAGDGDEDLYTVTVNDDSMPEALAVSPCD